MQRYGADQGEHEREQVEPAVDPRKGASSGDRDDRRGV